MRKILVAAILMTNVAVSVQAAIYDWNGSAGDGVWSNAVNWTEDSTGYDYPSEQYIGHFNNDTIVVSITNGDTVTVSGDTYGIGLDGPRDGSATAVMNVIGSTLTVVKQHTNSWSHNLYVARYGGVKGTLNLTRSTLNTDDLSVGSGATATGVATISNSNVNATHMFIAYNSGATGLVTISGTSTLTFSDYSHVGYSRAGSDATLTVNSGTMTTSGLYLGGWADGPADSTVNLIGGTVVVYGSIKLGMDVNDPGEYRININGGYLRVNALVYNVNDSKVVFVQGSFLIKQSNMSESTMNALIASGDIDTSGAASCYVTTVDVDGTDYTALLTAKGTMVIIK